MSDPTPPLITVTDFADDESDIFSDPSFGAGLEPDPPAAPKHDDSKRGSSEQTRSRLKPGVYVERGTGKIVKVRAEGEAVCKNKEGECACRQCKGAPKTAEGAWACVVCKKKEVKKEGGRCWRCAGAAICLG